MLNAYTCPACSVVDPLKEWTEVKLLGKGGFGEVLLYRNVNTGEEQAVKKVSFDPSNHQVPSHYSKTCLTVFKLDQFIKLDYKRLLSVPQIVGRGFLFFVCLSCCHGVDCTVVKPLLAHITL